MLIRFFAVLASAALMVLSTSSMAIGQAVQSKLRVSLECQGFSCDYDFLRSETGFADYVREPSDADVNVRIVRQGSGGGDDAFLLDFRGRGAWEGQNVTLRHLSSAEATGHEVREALKRLLQLGFAPYAAATAAGEGLAVAYAATDSAVAEAPMDPWNAWSFGIAAGGGADGEESYQNAHGYAELSATRVTERWKVLLAASANRHRSRFVLEDGRSVVSEQSSSGLTGLVVHGLGAHWSAGVEGNLSASTFENQDFAVSAGPAVEYSVFPYEDALRRLLTVRYTLAPLHADYRERTLYGKDSETRLRHSISTGLSMTEPWGEAAV